MGEIIVITSGKGGVGKTTTTANIGVGLALKGKTVLLVDTDIGLRNLDVVMGLENRIVYDLVDVVEERCEAKKAIIKDKRYEGLCLLPAAQTRDKNSVTPEQMEKLCRDLKSQFDYILIDCPAGIEQGFKNAIAGADRAIVVATPDVSSVRDADRIVALMEAHSEHIKSKHLVVNRIKMDLVNKGDMLSVEDMLEILAIELIGVVPDDASILVSTNKGECAVTCQDSKAGKAYRNIVERIITGEKIPLMDLEEKRGFLSRVKSLFAKN